jgi:hypothetical protein
MPRVRYEEMLPHEIAEARTRRPVAYLPIGTLEWHGEHLCVGNDAVKAQALAVRLAEEGGGLAFPALFWGENRESNLMESDHDPEGKIAPRRWGCCAASSAEPQVGDPRRLTLPLHHPRSARRLWPLPSPSPERDQ